MAAAVHHLIEVVFGGPEERPVDEDVTPVDLFVVLDGEDPWTRVHMALDLSGTSLTDHPLSGR